MATSSDTGSADGWRDMNENEGDALSAERLCEFC
jgi:hypothetical protein